ncbi:MAG: hypothetical protein V1933_07385 [Candidatus Omnitrophota bacterium]
MKQKKKSMITDLIPQETESKMLLLRGKKGMLDRNFFWGGGGRIINEVSYEKRNFR